MRSLKSVVFSAVLFYNAMSKYLSQLTVKWNIHHKSVVVQSLSQVWLFVAPWTAARQASLSFTISVVCSNSCPLSRWCHPTVSSSVIPFSYRPQSFTAIGSFPRSAVNISRPKYWASASASVLPMNIQGWFPLRLMIWSPCRPRDFEESSLAPQFKSINFLTFSLLYGPTLTVLFFKCFFNRSIAFWKKLPLWKSTPAFYFIVLQKWLVSLCLFQAMEGTRCVK